MHVVIWDLDDTLYHRHIQVGNDYDRIDDIELFPDVIPALTPNDQIDILVTHEGKKGIQTEKINALGIRDHFEEIHIVQTREEKGEVFADVRDRYSFPVYIVGDNVLSEIKQGRKLGMTTILCRRGKYYLQEPSNDLEKPDYVIKDLTELSGIIKKHG